MFEVMILNSRPHSREDIIYQGKCSSVILPGLDGEFEILDFHKPIITRLKKGSIIVDNTKEYAIDGGIAKMQRQSLVAFVKV